MSSHRLNGYGTGASLLRIKSPMAQRTNLGESRSERRSKCLRDCVLCFGDEVCIYHRGNSIYDHMPKVGLPILKVRPVESRQPPPATLFAKGFGRR